MTIGRSRDTLYNIQVLRFIAASMVLFGHLEHEVLDRKWLTTGTFHSFEPVFWPGGVDIFFVLSGFLMTYIAYGSFGTIQSSLKFLKRRIIRILPPYWFYTSLMVIAALTFSGYIAHPSINAGHLLSSFLLFPAKNPYGSIYPFFIIGWTLEYEVMFYVIFSLGLLFRRPIGLAFIYAAVLGLACSSALHPSWVPLQFWTNPIIIEFAFGMALCQLRIAGVRIPLWAGLLLSAGGIALMLGLHAVGQTSVNWGFRWAWMGLPALLLCTGLALQNEASTPGPLKRLLVFGGDASYSLYLSHPFTINGVAAITHKLGLVSPNTYILISFICAMLVSGACYIWVEKPIYAVLSKLGSPATKNLPASAV